MHIAFVFEESLDGQFDIIDGSVLYQLNIDRGSVGFINSAQGFF